MRNLKYILLLVSLTWMQVQAQVSDKEEALIEAIRQQDFKTVKSWVKLGADPNTSILSSEKDYTFYLSRKVLTEGPTAKKTEIYVAPIHAAAYTGNVKILKYLIKKGGNTDAQDGQGKTPLMYALRNPLGEAAALYLVKKGANYFAQDQNGNTALHYAGLGGNAEGIHMMLGGGLQPNQRNLDGITPALAAAMSPSIETMEQVKYVGGDIKATDSIGLNALHFAAAGGHLKVIEHLLQQGFEANSLSNNLFSPLDMAKLNKQEEARKYLLSKGSKLSNFLFEPLYEAVKKQKLFEVDRLLKEGANPNRQSEPPIVHLAAQRKSVGILNLLLQNGADPNGISSASGTSPIQEAMLANRPGNIGVLLKNGAKAGDSLLVRSILEMGNGDPTGQWEEIATLMLENRDLKFNDILASRKVNALHAAVWTGNYDFVRTLLNRGADPDQVSLHGLAPIHYLSIPWEGKLQESTTALASMKLLAEAGAKLNAKTAYPMAEINEEPFPSDANIYDLAIATDNESLEKALMEQGMESVMSAKFHQFFAKRLEQLGQTDKALYHCNEALSQISDHGPSLDLKGKILFKQKDYRGALKVLNRKRPNYPMDAEGLYLRGAANYQVKKYKQARIDLEKSISYDPENAQSWLMLGKSWYYLRNKPEACKAWKKSKKLGLDGAQQYIDAHCE